MTFQADLLHTGRVNHPRISRNRAVRGTWRNFQPAPARAKGERTALVSMAFEAARLVGGETLSHRRACGSVGIVAIDAGHRAFRYSMMKRFLKLSHHIGVQAAALVADRRRFARHQPKRTVGVNFMARRASHLIPRMAALQAAGGA